MAKAKTRRIVVEGRTYRWRRTHRHLVEDGQRRCEERLTLFADGRKASPACVRFRDDDAWSAGYPAAGVLWSKARSVAYNLNRPAAVRAILVHLLATCWAPDTMSSPLMVEEGFALLDAAGVPTGLG